jgi:hypothetical protein
MSDQINNLQYIKNENNVTIISLKKQIDELKELNLSKRNENKDMKSNIQQ